MICIRNKPMSCISVVSKPSEQTINRLFREIKRTWSTTSHLSNSIKLSNGNMSALIRVIDTLASGIPPTILTNIKTSFSKSSTTYLYTTFTIHHHTCRLHLWCPSNKISSFYYDIVYKIHAWLSIICLVAKNRICSTDVDIYLFLTDFKKTIPSDGTLTSTHVNSAFTYACSNSRKQNAICIYREEEWFKVFIHETMHCFGLDFISHPQSSIANARLKHIFPGSAVTDYLLYEMYVEIWADIINTLFIATISNTDPFPLLKRERLFAVTQALNILSVHGLTFTELMSPHTKNKYTETIPIFSYHICRAIVFSELNAFLSFCTTNTVESHNPFTICQFSSATNAVTEFVDRVVVATATPVRIQILDNCERNVGTSLRMTICDFPNINYKIKHSGGKHSKFNRHKSRTTRKKILVYKYHKSMRHRKTT